jgi:lysine 6-dehydrogenase
MKYKYIIMGSGMQGTAAAWDLANFGEALSITIADADFEKARAAAKRLGSLYKKDIFIPVQTDASDFNELVKALKGHHACLSGLPYFFNRALSEACIQAGVSMNDLGGNTDVVLSQHELDSRAARKGVTLVPDTGLMPGLGNTFAVFAAGQMDRAFDFQVRCGGLPQNPRPPLDYKIVFSIEGLINEYLGKAWIIKNGRKCEIDTFADLEEIDFPDSIGRCEAFSTTGGSSTLPWTLENTIQNYEYKTVRYPGHYSKLKTMIDLGLLSSEPLDFNGTSITPRQMFSKVVSPRLAFENDRDLVVLRSTVKGEKSGRPIEISYEITDYECEKTGFTAMERCTAFPAAVITWMLAAGMIRPGTAWLEKDIDNTVFMAALAKRDFRIIKKVTQDFA